MDGIANLFLVQTDVAGSNGHGKFSITDAGVWTYTADSAHNEFVAGTNYTDSITVKAADGTEQVVTVTITGTNDVPVAVADTASIGEAGGVTNQTAGAALASTTSGFTALNVLANDTDVDSGDTKSVSAILKGTTGTATDVDAGTTSATGQVIEGEYGTLVIGADGSYTYSVDDSNFNVQALNESSTALNDVFTYTLKDTNGLTSTATITVAVNGANDAPIVDNAIGDTTATIGSVMTDYVIASNAFTDVDSSTLTYTATLADGKELSDIGLSFNADTRIISGTPTVAGIISIKVTATDGGSLSASDTFDIVVGYPSVEKTVTITGISNDTGVAGDFITNDNNGLTISATLSAELVTGEVLQYSLDGNTWTTIPSGDIDGTAVSYADSSLTSTNTIQMRVANGDGNGQKGTAATQLVTIDTSTPSQTVTITDIIDNEGDVIGRVAPGGITDDTSLDLKGTLSAALTNGEVVKIYDGSNYLGNAIVSGTSWTFADTRTLANAQTVSYTAKVVNIADNAGNPSASYTATVNTSLPSIAITSIAGDVLNDLAGELNGTYDATERGTSTTAVVTKPVISGTSTNLEGQTITVTLNGTNYQAVVGTGGAWTVTLTDAQAIALNHGSTYQVSASGTSTGGKVATDTNNSLVVNTATPDTPTVVSIYSGTYTPTLTGMAQKAVPGTPVTYKQLETNDILTVTVGGATYTGTIDTAAANNGLPAGITYNTATHQWSVIIGTAIPTNGTLNLATGNTYDVGVTVNAGGVQKSDISSGELHINTVAPTITLKTISNDGYLNATEAAQSLVVKGETDAQVGSVVTLTGFGVSPAPTAIVLAGVDAAHNTFLVTLTAAQVSAYATNAHAGSNTFSASVINQFGLSGSDAKNVIIDVTGPSFTTGAVATANENIAAGTAIYDADATDSNDITYSLKAGTGDVTSFGINSSTGVVTLTGSPNYESKNSYGFTVVATDAAGNATEKAVTLAINNVNEAPTGASKTITMLEDGSKTFAAADFGFADTLDAPAANALKTVIITALPAGTLKLGTVDVTLNQSIAVADLGTLVFAPVANANGTGYTTIGFKVQDNGGIANGGADTSTTANTLTFNVTAVQEAPVIDSAVVVNLATINEDAAAPSTATAGNLVSNLLAATSDNDLTDAKGIAITGVGGSGTLYYSINGGTTWLTKASNSIGNASALLLDGNSRIFFKPDANFNGFKDGAFLYRAWDQTNGKAVGALDNTASNGGSTAYSTVAGKMGVTINAVNDAPVLAGALVDKLNQTVGTAFSYNIASSFTDVDNTLTYTAIDFATNGALPSWLTLNPTTGEFTGTPTENDAGTYSIQVVASDGSLTASDVFSLSVKPSVYNFNNALSLSTRNAIGSAYTSSIKAKAITLADVDASLDSEYLIYSGAKTGSYINFDNTKLAAGTKMKSFTATFKLFLSTTPGDGVAFSFGSSTSLPAISGTTSFDSTYDIGYQTGLSVKFNHGAIPQVRWNGALLTITGGVAIPGNDSVMRATSVSVDSAGVVTITSANNTVATATIPSSGWSNMTAANTAGWEFGLSGRTGSNAGKAAVDDLSITSNRVLGPVVIDLNHDGAISYSQTVMDVDGDGRLDSTAWAGAQDGVLVWDKYADGHVHDNSQYAFAQYGGTSDLTGLAVKFDTNHDGVFNAADAQFAEFKVWQDANQNGVSDAGEVRSLADLGIESINLTSDGVVRTPAEGVTEAGQTTATATDGSSVLVSDAGFAYNSLAYSADTVAGLGAHIDLLGSNMHLDLSSIVALHSNVAAVDLTGTGANSLKLNLSDVLGTAATNGVHTLTLTGDANDTVDLNMNEWTNTGTTVAQGEHTYAVYNASSADAVQLLIDQHMAMTQHG